MLPAEEQLHIIASGVDRIVPESALLEKLKRNQPLNIKLGVDPTAPDIHIGHAVPLRKLRQFQDLGHQVTLIIGDGTALIGDPSGRNSTRPQLTAEQVKHNAQTYVDQAFKVLDPEKTTLVYNSEWLLDLKLEDLLGLLGKFTVARILERDDFHNRYTTNQPIAVHEFLYPIMLTITPNRTRRNTIEPIMLNAMLERSLSIFAAILPIPHLFIQEKSAYTFSLPPWQPPPPPFRVHPE